MAKSPNWDVIDRVALDQAARVAYKEAYQRFGKDLHAATGAWEAERRIGRAVHQAMLAELERQEKASGSSRTARR